jgi:mono/diheme cytochrome c family protein
MDIRKTAIALLMGIALCVSFVAAVAQDMRKGLPFEPDPARGHETALKLCTGCHVIDKMQTGTMQPGVPSFLFMANKPGQTYEELENNMIHPFPPMIDAHLTIHEIKDISAYILSLKSPEQVK